MEYIEKLKKMLCKELDEYAMKNKLTMADVEIVHKLTDTVKNLDKIEMLEGEDEGYSEMRGRGGRYSYDDDMMYSEARGRGRNARRDSMGRYSSDMGGGSSYDGDDYRDGRGYSRDDAKDHLMSALGEAMQGADPNERKILKEAMRKIEEV
jgi:hypothetical protein